MINVAQLGARIDEALEKEDDSALSALAESFTPEEWQAIADALLEKEAE